MVPMPSWAAVWPLAVPNIIPHQLSWHCRIGMSLHMSRGKSQHAAPESMVASIISKVPIALECRRCFSTLLMFCAHSFLNIGQPVNMLEFLSTLHAVLFTTFPTVPTFLRPLTIFIRKFTSFMHLLSCLSRLLFLVRCSLLSNGPSCRNSCTRRYLGNLILCCV